MLMQPFVVGGLTKASGPPVTLPGRQTLIHAPTRFGGGVWADTQQLGRVPSWGPEIGMLTAKADREAVYAAHKAAGAAALWFCTFIHYQEDGVAAYPDGIAGWNDFTGNFSQAGRTGLRKSLRLVCIPAWNSAGMNSAVRRSLTSSRRS